MKSIKLLFTFAVIISALCAILLIGVSVMHFVDGRTVLGLSYIVLAIIETATTIIYAKIINHL